MRYHGRALTYELDNLLMMILADSMNLDALSYATKTIEAFARKHPEGFYLLLDLERNVVLPSDCTGKILRNQENYLKMGLKGFYLCCSSDLQKTLFSSMYIQPLKRDDTYMVAKDMESILKELETKHGIDRGPVYEVYEKMKIAVKKNQTTPYDLLPNE